MNYILIFFGIIAMNFDFSLEENNEILKQKQMAKYQLHIDERGSILPDNYNFSIVTKCIFDHGFPLAPGIFKCLISKDQNKENKRNCLFSSLEIKDIENILQCIHSKNNS